MKKIMVFTGSRADYGLLKNLLKRISSSKNYKLDIAASLSIILILNSLRNNSSLSEEDLSIIEEILEIYES